MRCPTLADLPPPPRGRIGWPWTQETSPKTCPEAPAKLYPTISIVTPSYNQGNFLEETIRSVLLQNYPNLEYFILDGGSNDDSVEIIERYSPWLQYWQSAPDGGQSSAINEGIGRCRGTLFNWLNSDDTLCIGALGRVAAHFQTAPDSQTIIGGLTINTTVEGEHLSSYSAHFPIGHEARLTRLRVNQPGSFLPADVVRAVGGVREDLEYVMDLDLWLRMILARPAISYLYIDAPIATYRHHANSKTHRGRDVFSGEEFALLFDLVGGLTTISSAPALNRVRRSISTASYSYVLSNTVDQEALLKSFCERLVLTDTLLCRALEHSVIPAVERDAVFLTGVAEIEEWYIGLGSQNAILSTSCLRAMQVANWPRWRLLVRYLGSGISFGKLSEIVRILIRRFRAQESVRIRPRGLSRLRAVVAACRAHER